MNDKPEFSIVVPCYNEALNLPHVVDQFSAFLSDKSKNVELVLVDNGSTDDTQSVVTDLLSKHQHLNIKLVTVITNEGYGHGILRGLSEASSDVLGWTHADLQTKPDDLARGYEIFKNLPEKNCVLKGKRKNRPFIDAFFTFGMQLVVLIKTGKYVDDINAQPKIFMRSTLEEFSKISPPPKDFSLDLFLLLMARNKGYPIHSFPVDFGKRIWGEAKGGGSFKTKFKLIKRTFSYIWKLN